jgi:hypothetical protein
MFNFATHCLLSFDESPGSKRQEVSVVDAIGEVPPLHVDLAHEGLLLIRS